MKYYLTNSKHRYICEKKYHYVAFKIRQNAFRFAGGITPKYFSLEPALQCRKYTLRSLRYLYWLCWMLVLRQLHLTAAISVHTVRMHTLSQDSDEHASLNTTRTRRTATYWPTDGLHCLYLHAIPADDDIIFSADCCNALGCIPLLRSKFPTPAISTTWTSIKKEPL